MILVLAILLSGLLPLVAAKSAYAPFNVSCPADAQFIRKGSGLSSTERDWVAEREKNTANALNEWLHNSNLTDFSPEDFFSNTTARIGLAFSGGGYRAMLNGAGQFAALDNRTAEHPKQGSMAGLVQAATYISGLSGGNWMLGSLVFNNWTTVDQLQHSDTIWDLSRTPFSGGGFFGTADLFNDVRKAVNAKRHAGFDASITDIWGRLLSYQFFSAPDGGIAQRFSDIREYDDFQNHNMPFPIHIAVGRAPGTVIITTNSTVFEFNPFEMGSWDPSVYAFHDIKFLGTEVENGKPTTNVCTNGFDNAGFIVGTSSSLFNQAILRLDKKGTNSLLGKLVKSILGSIAKRENDIASFTPNPFFQYEAVQNNITKNETLSLVDGGEDGQNIPLHPLIQPERGLDIVFAFDNSADTKAGSPVGASWANGSSLVRTYERQFGLQGNNTIFPHIPDQNILMYGGWVLQPTFFGCKRDNMTSLFNESQPESERFYPPVIVYMANSMHSFDGNASTFELTYEFFHQSGLINNGYNLATQNNGTIDPEWRTCVACAILLREQQRRGVEPSNQCRQCFDRYCYDGSTAVSQTIGRRDGRSNLTPDHTYSASVKSATKTESKTSTKTGSKTSTKSQSDSDLGQPAGSLSLPAFIIGLASFLL